MIQKTVNNAHLLDRDSINPKDTARGKNIVDIGGRLPDRDRSLDRDKNKDNNKRDTMKLLHLS